MNSVRAGNVVGQGIEPVVFGPPANAPMLVSADECDLQNPRWRLEPAEPTVTNLLARCETTDAARLLAQYAVSNWPDGPVPERYGTTAEHRLNQIIADYRVMKLIPHWLWDAMEYDLHS